MTDARTLNVRVAEALGCRLVKQESAIAAFEPGDFYFACGCVDDGYALGEHGSRINGVLDYDKDWSATGPLIEKHKINLRPVPMGVPEWRWWADDREGRVASSDAPLKAVCLLLIARAETFVAPA